MKKEISKYMEKNSKTSMYAESQAYEKLIIPSKSNNRFSIFTLRIIQSLYKRSSTLHNNEYQTSD